MVAVISNEMSSGLNPAVQSGDRLPGVSVIIAAWNARDTVRAAIESALQQSVPPLEVIVVDDGSVDGTPEVVVSMGNPTVRLIQQDNRGQSAALNRGVSESRGQYIKFLDADDRLNPHHLESQLRALSSSQTRLASCSWGYFVEDGAEAAVRAEHTNRDYDSGIEWIVDSLTLDEGMMGGWMWLIPHALLDITGGWNNALTLNNDFDFSVRLLLASSGVRFAPDAVYSYRKGMIGALSATMDGSAMRSAFETTSAGCKALLERENTPRIRQICADRLQWWMYRFFPRHRELASQAETWIAELGGSSVRFQGGLVLRILLPVLGWRRVRRMQAWAYSRGWQSVLKWKRRRMAENMAEVQPKVQT